MGKRRLGGWCCAAVMSLGLGCAQTGSVAKNDAKPETTESMVNRSAEVMQRYLSGEPAKETPREPRKTDAASTPPPRENIAIAPPTDRTTAPDAKREIAGSSQPGEPAPTPPVSMPPAAPAAVTHTPAPAAAVPTATLPPVSPSAAQPRPTAVSGFFSDGAVANEKQGAKGPALRVGALALCSKVEGFGKFVRMETARISGKPVAMLVYTQVEGFAYRTLGGEAVAAQPEDSKTQWVVDLGQTVVVYRLGADGKEPDEQVLYVPEQPCRDVTIGKRRDHFMTQRIELSPWIAPGKYAVKVTVKDKATGLVDERVTEIELR
jgi:hypothetical protein